MAPQMQFLLALAITEGIALLVVLILWRPMRAALIHPEESAARVRFWRWYAGIMLLLLPLAALLLTQPQRRGPDTPLLSIIDQTCWPVTCLVVALMFVGVLIGLVTSGKTVSVSISHEQADDLNRLLSKVDEIRARHILRRVEDPNERRA